MTYAVYFRIRSRHKTYKFKINLGELFQNEMRTKSAQNIPWKRIVFVLRLTEIDLHVAKRSISQLEHFYSVAHVRKLTIFLKTIWYFEPSKIVRDLLKNKQASNVPSGSN